MTAKYIGEGWTYEGMFYDLIIETTFFDQIFDHSDWNSSENVKPGDPPGIRTIINKNITIPRFMLFFNNYQNLHNTMFKSSGREGTHNCAFTIDALKTGTIEFSKERRNFCSIAVSALDEDNDFYIMNPKKLPTDSSIKESWDYFCNVLFTYLHMVVYMKICTKSEINKYFKSIFNINEQKVEKVQVSKFEYFFNISSNIKSSLHKKIESKNFECSLDYNKSLVNKESSIKYVIQDIVESHNIQASNDNSINNFNEVEANQIFIDRNYDGKLKSRLNTIANELKYDKNIVKIKNPTNQYSLYAYAGSHEYGQICNVHSEYYE